MDWDRTERDGLLLGRVGCTWKGVAWMFAKIESSCPIITTIIFSMEMVCQCVRLFSKCFAPEENEHLSMIIK